MPKLGLKVVLAFLVLTGLLLGMVYYLKSAYLSGPGAAGGALTPSSAIEVNLETSGGKVGEAFDIRAVVSSKLYDLKDIEFHVELPTSAVYLDGDWLYRGPLKAREFKELRMKAAFLDEGKWAMGARAQAIAGEGTGPVLSGGAGASFEVTRTSVSRLPRNAIVSDRPQRPGHATRPGELPKVGIGFDGPRSTMEILNKTSQPLFLLINSRAGAEDFRRQGLAPPQLCSSCPTFLLDTGRVVG